METVIAGAVCIDHVHLSVAISTKISISNFMGYLKGIFGGVIFIEASLNAYRSYIPFMSDAYTRLPDVLISISIAKTGQSPVAVSPLQMEKQMEEGQ